MNTIRPTFRTLILLSTLFAGSSLAFAQAPAPSVLQQCIADEAKRSSFSGVVSIKQPGGDVIFSQGEMSDPGSATMLADAQFNIGSAGKMWTAVAAAQLVDAKKISLDDNIGRFVTGLTREASAATIRQLLSHSSGLGNFFTPDNLPLFQGAQSLAELKPLVVDEKPAFTPGSKSQYSNSGFLLLGLLIEQVSGMQYGTYLQQHIFKPAGMTSSSLTPGNPKIRAIGMTNFPDLDQEPNGGAPMLKGPPHGALPGPPPGPDARMRPPPGPLRPSVEASIIGSSAGGSFSTPSDMQRFFAALQTGKLISSETLATLTTKQFEILPARGSLPAIHSGLGFAIGEYKGRPWIGHNGGAPGLNVATVAFNKDQITVAVMSNRDPPAADMMLRRVQAMLFDGSCTGT